MAHGAGLPFVLFPPSFPTLLLSLPSHFSHSPLPHRGLRSSPCTLSFSFFSPLVRSPAKFHCSDALVLPFPRETAPALLCAVVQFSPTGYRDASAQNASPASMRRAPVRTCPLRGTGRDVIVGLSSGLSSKDLRWPAMCAYNPSTLARKWLQLQICCFGVN